MCLQLLVILVIPIAVLGTAENNDYISDITYRRVNDIVSVHVRRIEAKFNTLLSIRTQEIKSDFNALLRDHMELKERFDSLEKENTALKNSLEVLRKQNKKLGNELLMFRSETEKTSNKNFIPQKSRETVKPTEVSDSDEHVSAPENSTGDLNHQHTGNETSKLAENQEKHIVKKTVHLPDLNQTTSTVAPKPPPCPRVAFFARMSHTLNNPADNEPIEFEDVVTNIGNSFAPSTSRFICHTAGTYVFHLTMVSDQGKFMDTEILLNGHVVALLYVPNSSSNMVVLDLQAGDGVWVRIRGSEHDTGNVAFGYWSTFSGFILWPN